MRGSLSDIVEKARKGDLEAFGDLVERFQDAAYGVALALSGNRHDAQDAAQEAFVEAWRDLKDLREVESFPAWLCGIARHRALDILRRREREAVSLGDAPCAERASSAPGPDEQLAAGETREIVMAAIRALPERERLATTLYYINGYSVEQVGEFLDVPAGTVKRRLHSARRRLKERMVSMVEDELKGAAPGPDFRKAVLLRVSRVEVRPETSSADAGKVFLVDDSGRFMCMIIGRTEEIAIDRAIKGTKPPRPMTHDLLLSVLESLGAALKEVRVVDLREGTFFGRLVLQRGGESTEIDCRPSDGLVLALLSGAKITVAEHVIDEATWVNDDGKPLSLEEAWKVASQPPIVLRMEDVKQAAEIGFRAAKMCGPLVEASDADLRALIAKLGPGKVASAFALGPADATLEKITALGIKTGWQEMKSQLQAPRTGAPQNPPILEIPTEVLRQLRSRLAERLASLGASDTEPVKLDSLDEVIKLQDEIKSALDGLVRPSA